MNMTQDARDRLHLSLKQLKFAPINQLDSYWKKKCIEFKGSDKELLQLFNEISKTTDIESSKFVRTLVNPRNFI